MDKMTEQTRKAIQNIAENSAKSFPDMEEFIAAFSGSYDAFSWNARQYTNFLEKVLAFKVSMPMHDEWVALSVNGLDLFDIHLIDSKGIEKIRAKNVYLEDVMERLHLLFTTRSPLTYLEELFLKDCSVLDKN